MRAPAVVDARSGPARRISVIPLTLGGWAIGAIVTVVIAATPNLTFGFRSPSGHLVLDSVDACVAALLAYLVYGRYLRYGRLQDLLLAEGLTLLAVAGLVLVYAADALTGSSQATLDVWLPVIVRVVGALTIAAAALAAGAPAPVPALRHWPGLAPVLTAAISCAALWLLRPVLPSALDTSQPPPNHPYLAGHSALWALQGVAALAFLLASVLFARQAGASDDPLVRWLGPACGLAGFARVNYVLYPSLYTDWLYVGDFLRTASYLILLLAALHEIRHYWDTQARALLADERRRLAGELHDGLIQELAFIRSESYRLPADDTRTLIERACDRAIDEARAAVYTLSHHGADPIDVAVRRIAGELAERHRVRVDVVGDPSVVVAPEQQHALLRIVAEAISNAARHGKARRIEVRLEHLAAQRSLSIRDDGHGFDVQAAPGNASGYGLRSMRERAQGIPGSLEITSARGVGSVVTVTW